MSLRRSELKEKIMWLAYEHASNGDFGKANQCYALADRCDTDLNPHELVSMAPVLESKPKNLTYFVVTADFGQKGTLVTWYSRHPEAESDGKERARFYRDTGYSNVRLRRVITKSTAQSYDFTERWGADMDRVAALTPTMTF